MEKQYHIALSPGQPGGYALLPGDPGRCEQIAAHFESPEELAFNREFRTFGGTLGGARVCVTSTGIGGPSAAIAMEELIRCGVHTFIRVGTCGGIEHSVKSGELVIATAAIRQEGTSREYVPIEYPAAASFEVVSALADAAEAASFAFHAGVVQCKDSFYGQHSPQTMPAEGELRYKWEAWKRAGALASEMESAALFCCAAARGVRCGAVFSVVWNQERKAQGLLEEDCHDTKGAVTAAVGALRLLIAKDLKN